MMKLAAKLKDQERGFTLIELMVVVLIIAILIAIAIPAFLGARKRAQRRQAQSALRNTLTTEKTYYSDAQIYITDGAGDLTAIEPNINYTTSISNDPNLVSVDVSADGQDLGMAAWSKSEECYYIHEDASAGSAFSKTEDADIPAATGCQADDTTVSPGATDGW
jgi:type IV pilus assembly protein PilA